MYTLHEYFVGSARRGGNTAILLGYTLAELEKEGIGTELVELVVPKSMAAAPAASVR